MHEFGNCPVITAEVVLDVSPDLNVHLSRHFVLSLQLLQHTHLLLVSSTFLVFRAYVVGERAACHGKGDDSNYHEEHTDDLLEGGTRRHVAVADRRNCCHSEIERSHIDFSLFLRVKTVDPTVLYIRVHLRGKYPKTGDNMRRHHKVTDEHAEPTVFLTEVERLEQPGLKTE